MKNLKRKPQDEGEDREPDPFTPEQRERQRQAGALVRAWMQEEDGYDAEVWPLLEQELRH
ncbi:MAG: hypothetical protein WAM82_28760 [Thermoanaerobaculia bacterium]